MKTGRLHINNVCHEDEDKNKGTFSVNNMAATTHLFSLDAFEHLRDSEAIAGKNIRATSGLETVSYNKKLIEDHIERNRTLTYLIDSFGLAKHEQYNSSNSEGVLHLF